MADGGMAGDRKECKNNLCEYFNRTEKKGCMITVCIPDTFYLGMGDL